MSVEWFCQIMGSEVGPLDQHQLIDMVRQHKLNPEDLVRRNSSPWVPAFDVKGLFEAAAKPAPNPPPEEEAKPEPTAEPAEPTPPAPKAISKKPMERKEVVAAHAGESPELATDWYCIASGEKRGPLGFQELQALARDGSLRGRDRVWRGSWPKFQKASDIDGLGAG